MSEKSRRMRILEEELENSSLSDDELMKIKRRIRDVKAADRKDAGDTEILEDLSVDTMLVSKNDTAVGPIPVNTGEYVTIDRIDSEENTAYITIFDVNGEIRDESVYVNLDDLKAFAAENEALTTEDIDEPVDGLEDATEPEEVTEGARRGARKSRRSRRARRGREDGEELEDDMGVEEGRKSRRRSRRGRDDDFEDYEDEPELTEGRRRSRRSRRGRGDGCEDCGDEHVTESFQRRMRNFASKRKVAQRKVATARTGFDLQADSMTFICEAGDIMSFDGLKGTVSVTRRGQEVLRDLKVARGTYKRCLEAGVFSSTRSVNEGGAAGSQSVQVRGAMLSYKPAKGYTFIREGVETGLGSRLRARAWLSGNGYNVTPDQLDSAYAGKTVTL